MGAGPWRYPLLARLMVALFPIQDTFVRGEISPRLHARASLELYRGALAKCENFISLPHGGIRKRGGTYFAGEVKDSSKETLLFPFIFSSDQAYALEVGDLYIRVYAYGGRVGTVEVVSPYAEADLDEIQFYQSADVMWLVHPDYALRTLTRTDNTTWTLAEYLLEDGPYNVLNESSTTLTPAARASLTPTMTNNTTPSGTASDSAGGANAYRAFDLALTTQFTVAGTTGYVEYDIGGGSKCVDAYWISFPSVADTQAAPSQWTIEGYNGSTWVVLDSQSGQSGWYNGQRRYFEFYNKNSYQKYKLAWSALNGISTFSVGEIAFNESPVSQAAFNLTASSTTGINDGTGFLAADVGRPIRLLGPDNRWRWARIISRTSSTVVTVKLYGHAMERASTVTTWRIGAFGGTAGYASCITLFEERLAFAKKFSVFASKTGDFDNLGIGEADDDALEFLNAGGGQANDIVWLADADGFLLIATSGGVRALSGSGIDEALTPTSFKNRNSRTYGCAKKRPIDAGSSFLYVTRSGRGIAELTQNAQGRFSSDDLGQISEHIPKKGVVEIAFQTDPDPLLWFPLENGELGGYTHQPAQEVRGMHRHRFGGAFTGSDWPIIERCCVTPGQDGVDDVWFIVKRTIGGVTKRFIEVMKAPFEYDDIENAFQVDCGLTYSGVAVGTFTGLSHLNGQVVDVLASGKVYRGLTVSGGSVTLPGGATATVAHVGLPYTSSADTLELDVGGKDGSMIGRRKKVGKVIMSLFETDTSGLQIASLRRGRWEQVKVPTIVSDDGMATLFTGNVEVPIDDSWEGMGQITIRHTNPTPCTIRSITPVFEGEP